MVMNVSSHMHVHVCGKGKNIFQETEYCPPAISGEITLTHILCIHFYVFTPVSLLYYIFTYYKKYYIKEDYVVIGFW